MKKLLIIVFGITVALTGCKKKNTSATNDDSAAVKTTENVRTPVIVFEKTPCFGTCPTYKVEIYDDGFVNYDGIRFVKLVGQYKLNIGADWVKNTLKIAEEINFFELEDRYDGNVTDLPSTIVEINNKKESKKITARYQIPDELKKFNLKIHQDIMGMIDQNADTIKKNYEMRDKRLRTVQPRPVTPADRK